MRTKITTDQQGRVTIEYDEDYCGETRRVRRTFTVREGGGYVLEHLDDGTTTQPCSRLASTGVTLWCSRRDLLPALIRREYRAMRRAEHVE